MSISGFTQERQDAVRAFGHHRVHKVRRIIDKHSDRLDGAFVLAIGLRESLLAQKIGGGTDRGVFQINDFYGAKFLKTHRGTKVDSYIPIYPSAYPKGRCPSLSAGCAHAVNLLDGCWRAGHRAHVAPDDLQAFSAAAYNCGVVGAYEGYKNGNVDQNTANGDYSRDVESMLPGLRAWLHERGW